MNRKSFTAFLAFICAGIASAGVFATAVHADSTGTFVPLTTVPGIFTAGQTTNPIAVLKGLYGVAIGIGAVIAVVMIMLAGFKYMYEESISGKSGAKEQITNAFVGLAVILGSYVILRTINTDLVNFSLTLPGGSGKVSGLIADEKATDALTASLHQAAIDANTRAQQLDTLKGNLTDAQAQLDAMKKQPQSSARDASVQTLQSQVDKIQSDINTGALTNLSLTTDAIVGVSRQNTFNNELQNLKTQLSQGNSADVSVSAATSLDKISSNTSMQLTAVANNIAKASSLNLTGDAATARDAYVLKAQGDEAYLATSKNMVDDLYDKNDNSSLADQSAHLDQAISNYNQKIADFESSGRKDLADSLRADMQQTVQLVKIRWTASCANSSQNSSATLCKP